MHDAGEPRSVYGNPREQGGLPSFLVLLLTVLGYGLRRLFTLPRTQYPTHRLLSTVSPRHSHILPFCTFAISARQPLTASRDVLRWFQMILLSATRSGWGGGGNAVTHNMGDRQVRFRVRFSLFIVITEYSVGLTPRLFSSDMSGSYVKSQKS